jgi:hypothetical protein
VTGHRAVSDASKKHRIQANPELAAHSFRRIRFNEGLAESRIGWIRPVLVNAGEAFAPVQVKGYEVR